MSAFSSYSSAIARAPSPSVAYAASLPAPAPTYTTIGPTATGALGTVALAPAIAEPAMQLQRENEQLRVELQRTQAEGEAMTLKLRDLDAIFKSRLSLLTDLYRVYKQLEGVDAQARNGLGAHDAFNTCMGNYRAVVGKHYTDQELAHLGSSRYFFPRAVQ